MMGDPQKTPLGAIRTAIVSRRIGGLGGQLLSSEADENFRIYGGIAFGAEDMPHPIGSDGAAGQLSSRVLSGSVAEAEPPRRAFVPISPHENFSIRFRMALGIRWCSLKQCLGKIV
jgi:hypothetical protein